MNQEQLDIFAAGIAESIEEKFKKIYSLIGLLLIMIIINSFFDYGKEDNPENPKIPNITDIKLDKGNKNFHYSYSINMDYYSKKDKK